MWIHRGWVLLPHHCKITWDPEYILQWVTFTVAWFSVGHQVLLPD